MKICGYLRCRLTKNSPRRTISTPVGVFCTLLASTRIFSKGLRRGHHLLRCYAKINPQRIRTDRDVRGSIHQRRFCFAKTRRQQMCTDVHLLARYLHRLFQKAYGKYVFRYAVAAKKLLLDVSFPTRMSVALRSNKFAPQTCSPRIYTDVYSWARMSVVPCSSKFFVRKTCR